MRKNTRKNSAQAATLTSDLMLAPMVAMMRLPLMAAEAGGSNPWGGETMRAVSEKAAAMTEGAVAAQMSIIGSVAAFWPEIFAGKTPSIFSGAAAEQSVNAALKPAGQRVRANFRRLSRI